MKNLCFIDRSLQFSVFAHKPLGNSICPSSLLSLIQAPFVFSPHHQHLPLSLCFAFLPGAPPLFLTGSSSCSRSRRWAVVQRAGRAAPGQAEARERAAPRGRVARGRRRGAGPGECARKPAAQVGVELAGARGRASVGAGQEHASGARGSADGGRLWRKQARALGRRVRVGPRDGAPQAGWCGASGSGGSGTAQMQAV
jgi:hypothetical protein